MQHGAPRTGGAVFILRGLPVGRLILLGAAQHRRMLIHDGTRAGTRFALWHRELGAGAGRPVVDVRGVLNEAPTGVAMQVSHPSTPLGAFYHSLPLSNRQAEGVLPCSRAACERPGGGLDADFSTSSQRMMPEPYPPS